jgi:2-polyprenyl-6-methoxyphenol hydroxylase-like FAD-dependent oxidoreductase
MESDVLIAGAGPAGLCLSLARPARGMQVEVVERQPPQALAAGLLDESPRGPLLLRHARLGAGVLRPRPGRGSGRP